MYYYFYLLLKKLIVMKNLKRLILLLATITLSSCSSENDFVLNTESNKINDLLNIKLIEKNSNNESIVTTDYLKEKWEKQSLKEGNEVEYEKFQILESIDEETDKKYYFLKASSKDNTIQTGAFLIKQSENVYALGGKECTCKGCEQGCNLTVTGQICRCSSCFPSGGKCEKTEKIIIGE